MSTPVEAKTRRMQTVSLTVCILFSEEQTQMVTQAIVIIINLCAVCSLPAIRYQRLNTGKCLDAFYSLIPFFRKIIK